MWKAVRHIPTVRYVWKQEIRIVVGVHWRKGKCNFLIL